MSNYSLSKRAFTDLDEILAFTILSWGEAQGDRYLSGLRALFQLVSDRPIMGRRVSSVAPGIRRVEHISHIVFYTAVPVGIRIERVLHKSKAIKKKDFAVG